MALPPPQTSWQRWTTSPEVIKQIDELLGHHTHQEIAALLNQRGFRSGKGQAFTARYIARIQRIYALKSRYDRLREAGFLTQEEMAETLGVTPATIRIWRAHGLLRGHAYTDKGDYLYELTGGEPRKAQGLKLSLRSVAGQITPDCRKEVQCEA